MRPGEKWPTACLLIIFSLFPADGWPSDEGSALVIDEKVQMDLGDYFFKEGDYYRAITEYKRFLFFFPGSAGAEEALFKIAKSYFNGKKWDESILAIDDLRRKFPSSKFVAEALLLKGLCFLEKKEYSQARHFFQNVQEVFPDSPVADKAKWQIALTYVKEERWKQAISEFKKISKNNELYPKSEYFAKGLERIDELPQKSPETAGILAAILPGAGHLYCERYRDAGIAFGLNAAFIWGMVEAFEHKSYIVGGILTFFELGWYSGNIYSAVSSAHKYNKKMRQEYLDRLEKGVNLTLGISPGGKSPLISLNYAF